MRISLPELCWYGNTTLEIDMPEDWDVQYCPMRGADRSPLSVEQMAQAIRNPIGSPRLSEMAMGKKTAVIVFDDMTRPTRTYELVPTVIEELRAGGIRDEDITFVCGLGTHGALTQHEFRKKLGIEILRKFRAFNHNCYENCVEMGTTSYGTPVLINREVAQADIKITIGCITAHPQNGFSGGGKLFLPGVAHIDAIAHHHLKVEAQAKETTGHGKWEDNILRKNIREAGRIAGLDFIVNVIFNSRGATTGVFAGDFEAAHDKGVERAKVSYATDPVPENKQVAITNAFAKPNEMLISILLGMLSLKDLSGSIVIIANSPEGQVPHSLVGRWGSNYGGRQYPVVALPDSIRVIVQNPYWDCTTMDWAANPDQVAYTENWEQTLSLLCREHDSGTQCAVIPNATMQYFDHCGIL
ncbi:MAG: lactate racemase domain-containing protein [Deltaproteobacteria bacterium]|nr:lactate racemase domain-containing protein [Deltaproteobacteria bacterium]